MDWRNFLEMCVAIVPHLNMRGVGAGQKRPTRS